jgi:hypothetical protein
MERYAELSGEQSTRYLLVDVRKFRHSIGEGVGSWRDEHIIPAYNAAGVEKFAFLFATGALRHGRGGERTSEGAAGRVSDRVLHGASRHRGVVRPIAIGGWLRTLDW